MQIETILEYYAVPTISARNALFHLKAQNAPGFSEDDTNCGVHPNPLGHRCATVWCLLGCSWPGVSSQHSIGHVACSPAALDTFGSSTDLMSGCMR